MHSLVINKTNMAFEDFFSFPLEYQVGIGSLLATITGLSLYLIFGQRTEAPSEELIALRRRTPLIGSL